MEYPFELEDRYVPRPVSVIPGTLLDDEQSCVNHLIAQRC